MADTAEQNMSVTVRNTFLEVSGEGAEQGAEDNGVVPRRGSGGLALRVSRRRSTPAKLGDDLDDRAAGADGSSTVEDNQKVTSSLEPLHATSRSSMTASPLGSVMGDDDGGDDAEEDIAMGPTTSKPQLTDDELPLMLVEDLVGPPYSMPGTMVAAACAPQPFPDASGHFQGCSGCPGTAPVGAWEAPAYYDSGFVEVASPQAPPMPANQSLFTTTMTTAPAPQQFGNAGPQYHLVSPAMMPAATEPQVPPSPMLGPSAVMLPAAAMEPWSGPQYGVAQASPHIGPAASPHFGPSSAMHPACGDAWSPTYGMAQGAPDSQPQMKYGASSPMVALDGMMSPQYGPHSGPPGSFVPLDGMASPLYAGAPAPQFATMAPIDVIASPQYGAQAAPLDARPRGASTRPAAVATEPPRGQWNIQARTDGRPTPPQYGAASAARPTGDGRPRPPAATPPPPHSASSSAVAPPAAAGSMAIAGSSGDLSPEEYEAISVGSRGHATRECRPCAFARAAAGCKFGQACNFCHVVSEHPESLRVRPCKGKRERLKRQLDAIEKAIAADPDIFASGNLAMPALVDRSSRARSRVMAQWAQVAADAYRQRETPNPGAASSSSTS